MRQNFDEVLDKMEQDPQIGQRDDVGGLIFLAGYLPPRERRLFQAVFCHSQSVKGVAELSGRPRPTIHRRLCQIVRRLRGGKFRLAVHHLDSLTPAERRLAEKWILAGRSLRRLAREHGRSLHCVRKESSGLLAKLHRLAAG